MRIYLTTVSLVAFLMGFGGGQADATVYLHIVNKTGSTLQGLLKEGSYTTIFSASNGKTSYKPLHIFPVPLSIIPTQGLTVAQTCTSQHPIMPLQEGKNSIITVTITQSGTNLECAWN